MVEFLTEFPPISPFEKIPEKFPKISWSPLFDFISQNCDLSVPEVSWILPGESSAKKILGIFLESKMQTYNTKRNDPTINNLSNLSPYLHFGQISAQKIVLEVKKIF